MQNVMPKRKYERSVQPDQRFWRRVDKNGPIPERFPELGPCWIISGAKTHKGYGYVWNGSRLLHAHRFSWELEVGIIPAGLLVLHRCDNPPCVRPKHLWLGTHMDNMRDMREKRRAASGQRNGIYTHPPRRGVSGRWAGSAAAGRDEEEDVNPDAF